MAGGRAVESQRGFHGLLKNSSRGPGDGRTGAHAAVARRLIKRSFRCSRWLAGFRGRRAVTSTSGTQLPTEALALFRSHPLPTLRLGAARFGAVSIATPASKENPAES